MRSSDQSPSIVPPGDDQDVYLVLDDFGGRIGQSWRETDVGHTDLETLIEDLLEDQYSNPVRIAAFNTAEGWSRDGLRRGGPDTKPTLCGTETRSRVLSAGIR
jgi:hypothetical protein